MLQNLSQPYWGWDQCEEGCNYFSWNGWYNLREKTFIKLLKPTLKIPTKPNFPQCGCTFTSPWCNPYAPSSTCKLKAHASWHVSKHTVRDFYNFILKRLLKRSQRMKMKPISKSIESFRHAGISTSSSATFNIIFDGGGEHSSGKSSYRPSSSYTGIDQVQIAPLRKTGWIVGPGTYKVRFVIRL